MDPHFREPKRSICGAADGDRSGGHGIFLVPRNGCFEAVRSSPVGAQKRSAAVHNPVDILFILKR